MTDCAVFPPQVESALNARRLRDAALACDCEPVSVMELHRPAVAPPLQHVKLLESTGVLLPMQAMPPGTPIPLDVLSRAQEAGGGRMASHAAPVDEDPTCERLATAEHAGVVLSSGAFECLVSLTHSWEVPVHVRAAHPPGGPAKPIAFVGKPFLSDTMTLRAKNEVYYKVRLLRPSMHELQALRSVCALPGSDSPTASPQEWGHTTSTGACFVLASTRRHASSNCAVWNQAVRYRLWQLGAVRLLTRCTDHAMQTTQAPGGAATSVVVRVKLEYAPQRGFEETTTREHARHWSALMLRPGATLAVAHVGVAESALLALEHKDASTLVDGTTEKDLLFRVRPVLVEQASPCCL